MIFKELRYLIFSRLNLVIGEKRINNVDTHDEELDKYDYYEVIGVRAEIDYFDGFEEEAVVVSLKRTAVVAYYEDYVINKANGDCIHEHSCEEK